MNYNFIWNQEKAKSNKKKHRIDFELAATVFLDPNAITIFDLKHSEYENRDQSKAGS